MSDGDEDATVLPLPDSLQGLIEAGVWGCLRGVAGGLDRDSLYDEVLAQYGLAPGFVALGPPFKTFEALATPPDPDSPENRLLKMIHHHWDPLVNHEDKVAECGLDDLEPGLALALAEADSYDYPNLILDYRNSPATVRYRKPRTLETSATWPIAASTFEDFAIRVGLDVDGPLYWTPGPHDPMSPNHPDDYVLDHEHQLAARVIARGGSPVVVECHVRGELIHSCTLRRNNRLDVTGQMKRALIEILKADDPTHLLRQFSARFPSTYP